MKGHGNTKTSNHKYIKKNKKKKKQQQKLQQQKKEKKIKLYRN